MNAAHALVLPTVLLAACGRTLSQDVDRAPLLAWLREHGREPVDYVLGKFAAHDVVLLGEHHEVRENCAFVARLVPGLAAAGVHCLVTEFLGLVFLVPVGDLHKVRWIDGFIDERHFEDARFVAVKRGWISKESDVADAAALNRRLAEVFR